MVCCGKAIVISVDNLKGGWNQLVEFADKREKESRDEREREKGVRDLNNLVLLH